MDPPDMWNECDSHRHDTFLAILVGELTVSALFHSIIHIIIYTTHIPYWIITFRIILHVHVQVNQDVRQKKIHNLKSKFNPCLLFLFLYSRSEWKFLCRRAIIISNCWDDQLIKFSLPRQPICTGRKNHLNIKQALGQASKPQSVWYSLIRPLLPNRHPLDSQAILLRQQKRYDTRSVTDNVTWFHSNQVVQGWYASSRTSSDTDDSLFILQLEKLWCVLQI